MIFNIHKHFCSNYSDPVSLIPDNLQLKEYPISEEPEKVSNK